MNDKYPFLEYINEDKSLYVHAKDKGFIDEDDDFLIGDSGGFLLNIIPGAKFVNTNLLTEMADFYRENKCYTTFSVGSIPYEQLRKRETYRRKYGYTAPCLQMPDGTIRDVHITGAHYNFLNYTRIEQLKESTIKTGGVNKAEKWYDFSKFIDAQYWTFKIMQFVEDNGFNLIIDKTRRGGFSYIMASHSANIINTRSHKVAIHVAKLSNYLTDSGGLTDFTIKDINFYETQTPFVRGIISKVSEMFKLGYQNKNGMEAEDSWSSSLISVSANSNPNCAIGKDAVIVKVEEVSTMNNFDAFMNVTAPAMRTGAYVTGTLYCWGTATAGDMQTFEQNFYNPKTFNFMPFENVWDKDSRNEICGYFKPYCWGLQGEINGVKAMDEDGNSNILLGLEIARREREKVKEDAKTYSDYINYLGQYANMPCESFSSTTENMFNTPELDAWEERLRTDKAFQFHVDGMLVEEGDRVEFKSNERLLAEGHKLNRDVFEWIKGVPRKAHEDPAGCIRRWFAPQKLKYTDKGGQTKFGIPEGLYSISYDPVGVDKDKKELTMRHSHNSIKVWMNPHPCNGYKPKLVAAYYGRKDKLEEADRICYNLARYYNCIGTTWVEVNRGETVSNFTKWKATRYLKSDDINIWNTSNKDKSGNGYGLMITEGKAKLEALRLFKEMLYTVIGKTEDGRDLKVYHTIYDYQSILEIKKWSMIGNYDRVSEMLVRAVEWADMNRKATLELQHRKKIKTTVDGTPIMRRNWF